MKNCNSIKCTQSNPQLLTCFSKNKNKKDGLQDRCKICNSVDNKTHCDKYPDKKKERDRIYRLINKEHRALYNKEWEKNSPEWRAVYESKWNKANPDKVKAKGAKWDKNNKDKKAAKEMRRQAQKLNATPPWLTQKQVDEITEFYTLAKELQWLSEEPLQVDHIIPLRGENVSGLHVPWNLQILPKTLNLKKGNRI